jgi:DHA1 family multidrug resistance protein-like MFS transporter
VRPRPRHINFLTNAAASAAGLFIPLYAVQYGATLEEVGFIVAAYNAFIVFASILFGRAADVQGVRRILRAGLLLSAVTCLLQPFAVNPWLLLASRALLGFCVGMYPAALLAYAKTADSLMGKFSSWGSLGWALGNLLAGVAAQIDPGVYWQVFALASAAWFLAFFLATTAPAEAAGGMRIPLFPRKVLRRNVPVYAMMFIRHTGANMIWGIFPIYLAEVLHLDVFEIGIINAFNPFVQFMVMQGIDRYGSRTLIIAGLLGSFATFVLFIVSWDFWSMLAIQIVLGFSWATLYVGSLKFITEENVETGTAGGWFNSVTSLSSIVGPILGGFVAAVSYNLTFEIAAAMALVALAAYLATVRHPGAPTAGRPTLP